MAKISIVGTPIGNMGDITLRAIETLKSADFVLCEDTRVTARLLAKYDIHVPTISYHSHSKISKTDLIFEYLANGKNLALVSDAGTPGISDPGAELVARIRSQYKSEIDSGQLKIEAIPGPSALTSALSIAGISCTEFTFLGFLPHKKGRETIFREIAVSKRTVVFYESPHRLMKSLEALKLFNPHKQVTICRELTKIFEEVVSGTPSVVYDYFFNNSQKVKGEFVVIVSN